MSQPLVTAELVVMQPVVSVEVPDTGHDTQTSVTVLVALVQPVVSVVVSELSSTAQPNIVAQVERT